MTRTERLLPAGMPRYVRCYDNGETADRYTVVFSGNYRHNTGGSFVYLAMGPAPFHPQGFGQHGESPRQIDRPRYGHLGRKIAFNALPDDCQALARRTYRDLWSIK